MCGTWRARSLSLPVDILYHSFKFAYLLTTYYNELALQFGTCSGGLSCALVQGRFNVCRHYYKSSAKSAGKDLR